MATAVVQTCVVGAEVPAANVVDESVAVIVDTVVGDLARVDPQVPDQIGIQAVVIKTRNQQRANRIRLHLALGGRFDAAPAFAPTLP